jgi:hypothetical protein
MSDRFYNESDGFFSSQMLMGKQSIHQQDHDSSSSNFVWNDLFPAFQEYVQTHVKLVQQCYLKSTKIKATNGTTHDIDEQQQQQELLQKQWLVLQAHKRYDEYSSVRDPAHGLLAASFGKDYADSFVYDVLFPLSNRNS